MIRILLIVCYLAKNCAWCMAQVGPDAFKDVPRGSWEYGAMSVLQRSGILITFSACFGYVRPHGERTLTRFEFAVCVDRTMQCVTLEKPNHGASAGLNAKTASLLHRFIGEYRSELAELGVGPKMRMQWLAHLKRFEPADGPFPDVSKSHWGSDAVERLRKLGVLRGYPDGLFHG